MLTFTPCIARCLPLRLVWPRFGGSPRAACLLIMIKTTCVSCCALRSQEALLTVMPRVPGGVQPNKQRYRFSVTVRHPGTGAQGTLSLLPRFTLLLAGLDGRLLSQALRR